MSHKFTPEKSIPQYLHSFSIGTDTDVGVTLENAIEHFFLAPVIGLGIHQFAYVFNMATMEIEKIRGVKTVLGYDEAEFDMIQFHKIIHPDDLPLMMQATMESTEHVVQNGETTPLAAQLRTTYRSRHVDGHYLHIQDSISCLAVDNKGMPVKGFCICTDISPLPFARVTAQLSCPCNGFSPSLNATTANEPSFLHNDFGFTQRENEILNLVRMGKSSEEIGQKLFISKHTVDKHRSNILQKAGVKRTHDLMQMLWASPLEL